MSRSFLDLETQLLPHDYKDLRVMKGAGDDSGFFQQGERLKWPQFTTLKSEGILLVGNSPAMSSAEVILTRLGLLAGESWKVAMFGHGMLLLVTLSESNPVVKFSMVFLVSLYLED